MDRLLRCVAGCAALAWAALAAAQQEAPGARQRPAAAATCQQPEHAGDPMLDREERIRQYETLGEPCLKRLLVECNAAANSRLLDGGSAFACSIGYEALLKRHFGGDFQAMLAWWRTVPERTALN
jgi:hypothetical protein